MKPTCPRCKRKLPVEHRWHGFHEKCFEAHFGVPTLVGGAPRTMRRLLKLADSAPPEGAADWCRLYLQPHGLVQGLELTPLGRRLVDELRPRLALLDQALAKRAAEGGPLPAPNGEERAW